MAFAMKTVPFLSSFWSFFFPKKKDQASNKFHFKHIPHIFYNAITTFLIY